MDVPEVAQFSEASDGGGNPVAFADMVLTALLAHDCALLCAEHDPMAAPESPVIWRIHPREDTVYSARGVEVGSSPSLGYFRMVLARFGHHYMGGQLYNGYALRFLRQRGRVHRYHIYMSNSSQSGFWIRVYSASTE